MAKAIKEMSLADIREEMSDVQPILSKAFAEAGESLDMDKVEILEGDSHSKSVQVAEMNQRLNALGERADELETAEKAKASTDAWGEFLNRPTFEAPNGSNGDGSKAYVSFADAALAARDEWAAKGRGSYELDIDVKDFLDREVKTVMSTGAGYAPQAIRTGIAVPAAQQMPTVVDLIPLIRTTQNAYVFMSQTTRTNNAAEIAESVDGTLATSAESAFAYTEVSETIRKLSHHIPVTDEQLEDIDGIEGILRNDMLLGIRQRLSSQLLNGTGTAPQIEGFLDAGRTGVNQHSAASDNLATAVSEGIEDVRVTGFAEPDGVVVHPTDWGNWERTTTADGVFIQSHPAVQGPMRLWGKLVTPTTEIAAGVALVGAFGAYSRLVVKRGVDVSVSTEHASNFLTGVQTMKAEMRATLAVLRESAFTEITGIV